MTNARVHLNDTIERFVYRTVLHNFAALKNEHEKWCKRLPNRGTRDCPFRHQLLEWLLLETILVQTLIPVHLIVISSRIQARNSLFANLFKLQSQSFCWNAIKVNDSKQQDVWFCFSSLKHCLLRISFSSSFCFSISWESCLPSQMKSLTEQNRIGREKHCTTNNENNNICYTHCFNKKEENTNQRNST